MSAPTQFPNRRQYSSSSARPGAIGISREHQRIRNAGTRALAGELEVPEDARAEIERRDLQRPSACEIQSQQRIHEGKRLDGLLGIEVVPFQLVGEVQPWPDDRHALHRAGRERACRPSSHRARARSRGR